MLTTYADYAFYSDSYKGDLSEHEFNQYIIKATAHVRRITFGRADDCPENVMVKLASCAVCDTLAENASFLKVHQGHNVVSENNDGYSVSFAQEQIAGETVEGLLERKVYKTASVYLMTTGLLCLEV